MSAADTGSDPAGEGLPAVNFTWDGAATPTLTVTEQSDGTTAAVISGQALAGEAAPPEQLEEAGSPDGKDPEEALLT